MEAFDGSLSGVQDLDKFQRPNSAKRFIDTIKTWVIDDAQHPGEIQPFERSWLN